MRRFLRRALVVGQGGIDLPISQAVILEPGVVGRNTITPTGDDVDGLVIRSHSPTATARLLQVIGSGAASSSLSVRPPGSPSGLSVLASAADPNDIALLVQGGIASAADTFVLIALDAEGNSLAEAHWGPDLVQTLRQQATDDPGSNLPVAAIIPGFRAGLAASWQGRLDLAAIDSASPTTGRLGVRVEADGAAARIGFLGAAAVPRQIGASAAALAAITDPNAKAALQALQTALANLGLVTSPA